jgi:ribA/ribD-fused uncharacterized protein
MSINDFRGDLSFLSNFYKTPIFYRDTVFKTSEHAYQWAKCDNEHDRSRMLAAETPRDVKRIGHEIKCDIKKWDSGKVAVMREILVDKFKHKRLMKQLVETGDFELVEGNHWHDNFWGDCYCVTCKKYPGSNHLGKLLMEIRHGS